jgi:hypothetical protein
MPIQIRYRNDTNQECVIRPTPLISIGTEVLKTGGGEAFGVTYSITLTGTLLEDQGFPLARDSSAGATFGDIFPYITGLGTTTTPGSLHGPYESFDTSHSHAPLSDGMNRKPLSQLVPTTKKLGAILFKQKVLRGLFAIDGQRVEISSVDYNEPAVICYPRLVSIDFEDGPYVSTCAYTIVLEADTLLNKDFRVDNEGNPRHLEHTTYGHHDILNDETVAPGTFSNQRTKDILDASGAFIQSFSENWSIEAGDEATLPSNLRSYRISHQMSATGKTHYGPIEYDGALGSEIVQRLPAWKQARDFVQKRLLQPERGIQNYPNVMNHIGSGTLNLVKQYRGYNHVRTEEVSVSEGTYSVNEDWLLASGTAYETYDMSISNSLGDPFVNVSINGNVTGLSEISPSGRLYGGREQWTVGVSGAYDNAIKKYHEISNSGRFGLTSDIYRRVNNSVAVQLNSQPKSLTVGTNELDGTIVYSLEFDNRPTNIISGVLSESISVNDTYPGDVFAVIPVIGRRTGPVLQYVGGRTEYKRALSIELQLDYTEVPYGSGRSMLLYKPSLVEPTRTQLRALIEELSPKKEPGIRKWFVAPPTENWNPRDGKYSFNVTWTYELDK